MLTIYNTLAEVPEALKEHYKLIEGKYVPEISDDHPIKANNVKLLNGKTAAETKASGLETANAGLKADIESAKAHSLPRGHRAVPVAEVEAMEKMKEHGTATEITTKLTEHKMLKDESLKRKTDDNNRLAAKELGYNPDAFLQLTNLPEFEIKDVGGKKSVIAKVKDGETVTEKPAKEYIESTYAPLMPALQAKPGVELPVGGGSGSEGSGQDPYQWAKDFGKSYVEQNQPVGDAFTEFNKRQSA